MPRFTQKGFFVMKEMFLESSDEDVIKSCSVMYRFLSKADRSKVFSIPITAIFPVLRLYAKRFIKRIPYLIKG